MLVYYKGQLLKDEPGRTIESLLTYVDKLNKPAVIELNNQTEADDFVDLSDSFLVVYEDTKSDFYKCVEDIAEKKHKITLNFGGIHKDNYKNDYSKYIDEDGKEKDLGDLYLVVSLNLSILIFITTMIMIMFLLIYINHYLLLLT